MKRQPVVVGVDGSAESLRAASMGWRLARAADAPCLLVYAVPDVWAPGGVSPLVNSPDILEELAADVRRHVAAELAAEMPPAVREGLIVRTGRPGVVLAQVAKDTGAGLVVVGARRHGALARALGGSTAHHLVRTADALVLVVEGGVREPQRVLVATDLSLAAGQTLQTTARYAEFLGARIRALHVIEPVKFPTVVPLSIDETEFAERSRAEFERLIETELPDVPPDDRIVRRGLPDEEIAEEVAAWKADLLILGSHGKGWIDRMLIGSTTERLLNRVPTSLLIVPIAGPAGWRALPGRDSARGGAHGKGRSSYESRGTDADGCQDRGR